MIGPLDTSVDCARYWFSNSLHHLGPLRAAPQPLYGLPEAASGASVGKNGEYTAAVLNTYGKKISTAPLPEGGTAMLSLAKAVDRWVNALGLLASVKPVELGKYGFELTVNIEGVERPLDLTTVGVGVSQALPIVVLGLISEPGATLLFEQPELHLHPDVQAALGDFFLALARSGRQLIIETHSEYLINRLRRRQVTDTEPDAADLVRLFFFERAGPSAKVIPTRIGSDGSMPGWPTGFLDTAAREIEATVLGQPD
jgi:predicted ATPase